MLIVIMLNKYLTPISQPSYMEWVDWTKIIGIFLVTLGHGNLVSVELNTFIYSFHMPLFLSFLEYCSNIVISLNLLKKDGILCWFLIS